MRQNFGYTKGMFFSDNQSGGFATIAIVGGVAVAVVIGGIFYFLRPGGVAVDSVLKGGSAVVLDDAQVLDIDAEQALLRSLPRKKTDDYCVSLGLSPESCVAGVEDVCSRLFNDCSIDTRNTTTSEVRSLAEACLVLGNPDGREMYYQWLDSDTTGFFPLYYSIFGLQKENFTQKDLADSYRLLLDARQASSCDNREIDRIIAEGYLVLRGTNSRIMYDKWLEGRDDAPFPLYYGVFDLDKSGFYC